MLSNYKQKILEEIERVPDEKMSVLYKFVHLLTTELMAQQKSEERGSLQGIWRGSQIDDELLAEARRSLFPYEGH
jgi:hypothetical protein